MFTIEGLTKQLANYGRQRIESQQMVHHLAGAMQVLEHQIGSLKDEALRLTEAAAKQLAEEEAAKLLGSQTGEAVMDVLIGSSTEEVPS